MVHVLAVGILGALMAGVLVTAWTYRRASGLLLIARNGQSAKRLAESFRDRETEKLYWAVVVGVPPKKEGAINLPLAKRPGARDRETMQVDHEEGQKALTHFREMDRAGRRASLLALWPRTGRTHQLRVHCAEMGCPILGDRPGDDRMLPGLGFLPVQAVMSIFSVTL